MKRQIEVIAEIGVNHNGDIRIAKDLISKCKEAGADTVKFQLYDPKLRPDIEEHPWKDILLKSALKRRNLYELKAECDRVGVEFLCSVFDIDKISWLEEIGIERYKIASKSIYNFELVEEIKKTKKPIIISFGMLDDKKELYFDTWKRLLTGRVFPLYCISNYPTEYSDLEFDSNTFKEYFFGFSDHTVGITASIVAMSLGARIIEKHITFDKNAPGPDHFLSLLPEELNILCTFRDEIERILYGE